jgi:hypothetical protein
VKRWFIVMAFLATSFRVFGISRNEIAVKLSIGEDEAIIRLGIPLIDAATRFEGGVGLALDVFSFNPIFAQLESEEYRVFVGMGEANDWFALRAKPDGGSFSSSGTLWSIGDGGESSSLLYCFGYGGLRFFAQAEPGADKQTGVRLEGGDAIDASFRRGGIEMAMESRLFCSAVSASISDRPAESSGEGWRPGNSYSPGATLFTLSSAVSLSADNNRAGIWASASAGYLESPGFAASFNGRATLSLGGSHPSPGNSMLSIDAFVFGSSPTYLTASGEAVLYDFVADGALSLKMNPCTFEMKFSVRSFPEGGNSSTGRLLQKEGVSALDRLLWHWKTDLIRANIELQFGVFVCSGQLSADAGTLRSGSVAFRCKLDEDAGPGLKPGASVRLFWSRSSDALDEESGSGSREEDSLLPWENAFGLGDFGLRSIKIESSLKWGAKKPNGWIGRGSVGVAISARKTDSGFDFALACALSQKVHFTGKLETTLVLKSPKGGYSLDSLPVELPCVGLEFSISTD